MGPTKTSANLLPFASHQQQNRALANDNRQNLPKGSPRPDQTGHRPAIAGGGVDQVQELVLAHFDRPVDIILNGETPGFTHDLLDGIEIPRVIAIHGKQCGPH